MTIRVTLNCQLNNASITPLLPFLEQNLPNVRGFDGCEEVQVYFDENKQEMLLEEKWQSIDKHQQYMKFIEENGVLAELATFFEAPPVIKYFEKAVL